MSVQVLLLKNLSFMIAPSTSSTNDANTASLQVSIASPNVNTASPHVSIASFSDNVVYAEEQVQTNMALMPFSDLELLITEV
ncbi:hypothetical protein Tco_0346440 [Tanacetum coccineum]